MENRKEHPQQTPPVEPTIQIQPPPVESGSKTKFILGFVCALLLLVVGGGVYYFMGNQQTGNSNQLTTISQTVQPTIDPTANWKTYENEKYKMQFKYPSSWQVLYDKQPDPTGNPSKYSIVLQNNNETALSVTLLKSNQYKTFESLSRINNLPSGPASITSREEIRVNGIKALSVNQNDGHEGVILLDSNQNLITFEVNSSDRPILDQILSTFKFTDSDQAPNQSSSGKAVDTSNWKSFTAEDMDFGVKTTLKLPPGYSFSFTGSEFMIQDDSNFSELWEYATSITTNGVNTYSNQSRRVWYEQYLQGQHGGAAGRDAKIISAAERSYNAISYLEAVVSVIGKNQTHYLYVQNGIFNIISPSSEAAHLPNSVIAKNIGPILQSLSVSKTR